MTYNEFCIINDLKRVIQTYEEMSKYMTEEQKVIVVGYIVAIRAIIKKYEVKENV